MAGSNVKEGANTWGWVTGGRVAVRRRVPREVGMSKIGGVAVQREQPRGFGIGMNDWSEGSSDKQEPRGGRNK